MKLSFLSFTTLLLLPMAMVNAVDQADMDGLVDAFCGAAVAISDAFWNNGGKHHYDDEADNSYPEAACKAAYDEAWGALNGAYNYPDPVLFKPTLTTEKYTFRPTIQGALSYFIGTDCVLSAAPAEDVFPPGNTDGSTFKEYGFALANYGENSDGIKYAGFNGCTWTGDSYVTSDTMGVAQGKVCFSRTEGGESCVDKTFSFGMQGDGVVITGHHSSGVIIPCDSTQFVFDDSSNRRNNERKRQLESAGCPTTTRKEDENGRLVAGDDDTDGGGDDTGDSPGTTRKLAGHIATAIPAFFLGGMMYGQ